MKLNCHHSFKVWWLKGLNLALTAYPQGLSSFGVPLMGGSTVPTTTGNYYFVQSTFGTAGTGLSADSPVLTLAAAQTMATANNGDVIIVMPGHTETVTAAAGKVFSKAGIYYIGMGTGFSRPTITFTTITSATMTITAANVTIDNFVFLQTFDAIVSPIVVSAAQVTFKNCYFQTASATAQCTQMILTTAAADNFSLIGNRFFGTADAGTTSAVTLVGGANINIIGNDFLGNYTTSTGPIQCITTLTTGIVVRFNSLVNATASATKAVTLLTGSTGMICDNRVGIGSGAAPFTIDAGWWAGNWSAAAVATNGTLV